MYKGWISYTRRSISLISENIIKKQGLKKERSCLIFLESFNPIPENNVTERSVVIKNKVRKEIIKKSLLPHARLAQKPSGIKIKDKKTASLGEIFLSLFCSPFKVFSFFTHFAAFFIINYIIKQKKCQCNKENDCC